MHSDRVRLLMSGRQLELSLARETDTALYTCTAHNVAGSAQIQYNLTVLGTSHCARLSHILHVLSGFVVPDLTDGPTAVCLCVRGTGRHQDC